MYIISSRNLTYEWLKLSDIIYKSLTSVGSLHIFFAGGDKYS